METKKFVAVLNKKIETWKAMNALAHMTVGMTWTVEDDMWIIDYKDKDNSTHIASKYPYIILRAKNSNQIRTLRNNLITKWIPFASFTEAMTIWTWQEQVEKSKLIPQEELEYYWICMFWDKNDLDELTKKFSLWL